MTNVKPARTTSGGATFRWRRLGMGVWGKGEALPPLAEEGGSRSLLTSFQGATCCSVLPPRRQLACLRPPCKVQLVAPSPSKPALAGVLFLHLVTPPLDAAAFGTSPHNEAALPLRCSAPGRAKNLRAGLPALWHSPKVRE